MTVTNTVACDVCGKETHPPRNSSWAAVMVWGPDGLNFVDAIAHLCESCKIDLRKWIEERRAEAAKKRLVQ